MATVYPAPLENGAGILRIHSAQWTDKELLARILNPRASGSIQRLVGKMLVSDSLDEIVSRRGRVLDKARLSPTQTARLAAALELADRVSRGRTPGGCVVRGPQDIYELTSDLTIRTKEHFVALYLNARNGLITRETVSIGSLNASIVHPREVFEPAIRAKACSVIVVHNHPSGNPQPSEDDVRITRRLREAGEILGIQLLDHVIVGLEGFVSLEEEGYRRS